MCLAWCAFVVLGFGGTAQAQAPPYDADDAHARRLYEQYKQSQEREKALEAARRAGAHDAREAAYGTFGALGVDREALANANRAAEEAQKEREKQQKLIKAWDKKFSGRFGDLKETSSQAPLPPQPGDKPYKDKMDMRLNWFRYNPNAGKTTPPPGYTPKTPGYVPRSATAPPYPPGRSPTGTQTSAPKDKPPKLGAGIRPPDDYRDTNSGGSGGGGSSGGGGGGGY